MKLKIGNNEISDNTNIGIVKDIFENENGINEKFEGKVINVQEFFDRLENNIREYYK